MCLCVCSRVLERASISLLLEGQVPAVIQSQSCVHRLPAPRPPSPPEPVAKRKRPEQPGGGGRGIGAGGSQRLVLTAVCELTPLLACAPVKCPVTLHYVVKEASACARPRAPGTLQCGWVSISLPDGTQGLHQPSLLLAGGSTGSSTVDIYTLKSRVVNS